MGVTAEIYNLEGGSRAYVLGHREDIRGKLILDGSYTRPGSYLDTTRGRDPVDLDPSTLYGYLEQFGAAGLLYSNRNYGALPITGTARYGLIGKIPACGISREASQFIVRQLCKETVVANLKVQNTYASGARSYNVIADLPGRVNPEEIILVGGHYDGLDISVGAMDDAAGACVVLESARALAKYGPFKRTIRFCCFAGEEVGLNGSTGYVIDHADELKNVKLMINTDAAGISAKTGHGFQVCGPEELIPYLEGVLKKIGKFDRDWEVPKVTRDLSSNWDHWPFYMRGVPTAHLRDIPPDPIDHLYSHTVADTIDKVQLKAIRDAAVILSLVLMEIADEDEIPVKHTAPEKIAKFLEEIGIAENLRVENRWRREFPN